MKLQRHGAIACLALTAVLGLSACGSDNNEPANPSASGSSAAADCATGTLNAQGSSAQKNAVDEWIKAYQQQCNGAQINYEPSGSGAGIRSGSRSSRRAPPPRLTVSFRRAFSTRMRLAVVLE